MEAEILKWTVVCIISIFSLIAIYVAIKEKNKGE